MLHMIHYNRNQVPIQHRLHYSTLGLTIKCKTASRTPSHWWNHPHPQEGIITLGKSNGKK